MITTPVRRLLVLAVTLLIVTGATDAETADQNKADPEGYPHGSFRGECAGCHSPESWKPAVIRPSFDHAKSGFALEGAHRTAKCLACHTKLDFSSTSTDCVSCHGDVHRGELGPDCSRCHTTNSFVERADEIRSHRTSRFPLTGIHIALDCRECHKTTSAGNLMFVNTPGDCQSCHIDDYQGARDPDHVTAGFSRECEMCHTTLAWTGRGFNHALTGFALSGEHRVLDCNECHTGGFTGAAADCVDCHQDDYDQTTDPDHQASSFPPDCGSCHNSRGWSGANFNHGQWFPIASGRHAQEWNACSDCHTNPTNYSVFTCLSCHPHSDKNETDGHHKGRKNYVYDSAACYDCHPNGRGD
jgi:hypothetical protein